MKRESFENGFAASTRAIRSENWGFKLPQLLCTCEVAAEEKRIVRSTMTLVAVEQAQFGKNLKCTYMFETHSTVTDSLIQNLGFNAQRLRSMEIVPSTVRLHQAEVVKEFASANLERSQLELFEKYKQSIQQRDFSALICEQIRSAAKKGPQSRFAS